MMCRGSSSLLVIATMCMCVITLFLSRSNIYNITTTGIDYFQKQQQSALAINKSSSLLTENTGSASAGASTNSTGLNVSNTLSYRTNNTTQTTPPTEYPWNKTNATISVCLYMNAERIKLLEWLAYHYTTLPFGKLIVGIDPKAQNVDDVRSILLDKWKGKIDVTLWLNDTYGTLYKPLEGWSPIAAYDPMKFLQEASPVDLKTAIFVRNQKAFAVSCMNDHYKNQRGWVWIADTDEYVMPNYVDTVNEMDDQYDGYHPRQYNDNATAIMERIRRERSYMIPIRETLPPFSEHITMADLITQMPRKPFPQNPHCYRFPDLKISGYETDASFLQATDSKKNLPTPVQQHYLVTLRQRWFAPKTGEFSKAIIHIDSHTRNRRTNNSEIPFHTVHRPHTRLCSSHTSGADFQSSWLRINHYRTGTLESMLEQLPGDFRLSLNQNDPVAFFRNRNSYIPVNQSHEIVGWVEWFVEKVGGMGEANRLLFDPLDALYAQFDTSNYTDLLESLKHIPNHTDDESSA